MAETPRGVEIKIKKGDSEIDKKVIGRGFELLGRIVIGNGVRTDRCFYDDSLLEKMGNLKDRNWIAYYRCPECNRRYVQEVGYEERNRMKQGRIIKYVRKRKERLASGRRAEELNIRRR